MKRQNICLWNTHLSQVTATFIHRHLSLLKKKQKRPSGFILYGVFLGRILLIAYLKKGDMEKAIVRLKGKNKGKGKGVFSEQNITRE